MVEQWKSDGGIVWWNGETVWWDSGTMIVEQCCGTVEQ